MIEREPIFQALFALAQTITWGAPPATFAYSSRRVKLFSDLSGQQPALCQAESDESFEWIPKTPAKRTLSAAWLIYQNSGADAATTPTTLNNTILDAVEAALAPPAWSDTQTLGGLVEHCWIDGKVFKDPGDLDGQGLMVVPVKILIP